MENEKKLQEAFQKALGLETGIDFKTLEYGKAESWDSVAHMALIAAIEEVFDIMIDTDDRPLVIEMNTVPGMTDHSLAPMAAKASGIEFDDLVWRILETSFCSDDH